MAIQFASFYQFSNFFGYVCKEIKMSTLLQANKASHLAFHTLFNI